MPTPNSTVKLLRGVDIDNSYKHTFSFSSASAQSSFFLGKVSHSVDGCTYIRKERKLRVPLDLDDVYDCNYLMFQNPAFGSKWFYAFILTAEYVNENMCEITFEIDAVQTWYFETEINDCFIEREHVTSDTIGTHTISEGLDIGEVIIRDTSDSESIRDLVYMIGSTVNAGGVPTQGGVYTDIYSGVRFYASDDPAFLNSFINAVDATGAANAIVSISTLPKNLVDYDPVTGVVTPQGALFTEDGCNKNTTDINGYVPRNNKLFTYPYNYLEVVDYKGGSQIYRYEYFGTLGCEFYLTCNVSPVPVVIMYPKDYKGSSFNDVDIMTLGDYPQCAWVTDAFRNWLAQNAASTAITFGGSALAIAGGLATANPLGVLGGLGGVVSAIGGLVDASVMPPVMKGNPNGSANVARGKHVFGFIRRTIRAEQARVIDNFFHAFGYKTNRLGTPSRKTRANWNFIKCTDANIAGDIPHSDISKIKQAFLNGITYWHSDAVGNYNRSNPIV